MTDKIFKLIIVFVVCFSLWLNWRAFSLPYWFDEANSIYYVTQEDPGRMIEMVKNDFSPPLYYYILRGWVGWAGTSEAATASLSFIFALITIVIIYWAAKKMFNKQVALCACLIFVCSPLFLIYGTETRMYSLVLLLAFMSMGCAWLAIDKNKFIYWLGLIVFSLLGVYTHYTFWFIIVAQNVFVVIYCFLPPPNPPLGKEGEVNKWRREGLFKRLVVPWIVSQVVTVVVFGRWWLVLIERITDTHAIGFSYWPQIVQGGSVLGPVSFLLTSFSLSDYFVISFLIELFLLGIVLMVFFRFNKKEKLVTLRQISPSEILILILVCVPIFINNILGVSVTRYTLFSLVLFYLMIAIGISKIKTRQAVQIMLVLVLVASLVYNVTISNQQITDKKSRWATVRMVDYLNKQTQGAGGDQLGATSGSPVETLTKSKYLEGINNHQGCFIEEGLEYLRPEDQIIVINPANLKVLVDYYYEGDVETWGAFPDSKVVNNDLEISKIRRISMSVVTKENVGEIIDKVKTYSQVYLVQYLDKIFADPGNLVEMRLDQECRLLEVWSPSQTALLMPYVVRYGCGRDL